MGTVSPWPAGGRDRLQLGRRRYGEWVVDKAKVEASSALAADRRSNGVARRPAMGLLGLAVVGRAVASAGWRWEKMRCRVRW